MPIIRLDQTYPLDKTGSRRTFLELLISTKQQFLSPLAEFVDWKDLKLHIDQWIENFFMYTFYMSRGLVGCFCSARRLKIESVILLEVLEQLKIHLQEKKFANYFDMLGIIHQIFILCKVYIFSFLVHSTWFHTRCWYPRHYLNPNCLKWHLLWTSRNGTNWTISREATRPYELSSLSPLSASKT